MGNIFAGTYSIYKVDTAQVPSSRSPQLSCFELSAPKVISSISQQKFGCRALRMEVEFVVGLQL